MATTNITLKVITEVKPNAETFKVFGFHSQDSLLVKYPRIFRAKILDEPIIVDNVSGKEGELFISSEIKDSALLKDGNLILDIPGAFRYSLGGEDDAYLLYNDSQIYYSADYSSDYSHIKEEQLKNILQNLGDVLSIHLEPKMKGKIRIENFRDSITGETNDRTLRKEFRVSQDGLFWSNWAMLTDDNLYAEEYIVDNSLFIELRYTRTGTDDTGTIIFNNIDFNGTCAALTFEAPTLFSSILNRALGTNELSSLEINIFKKLYYRGILPNYIERADDDDYKEDKDFVDLFFSIARFFSLFIIFFRRWEKFKDDEDLLREQVRGYGIYFNEGKITLEELQYLARNLFSQAQQRGTQMIFTRRGDILSNRTEAPIDGEFIRLTQNRSCDELLYENVPKWKMGWCMNQSSPMYKGTSRSFNLNKTRENSEDFQSLSNFVLSKSGSGDYSLESSGNKRVLKLNFGSGNGRAGLGRASNEDISNNLYTADSQMDYEITFAFKLNNASSDIKVEFGVEGFDINKNYLNDSFITPNGFTITNEFLNQATDVWQSGKWYFVRGIIHAYGSSNVEQETTNLGFGTNLYFNNPFLKYILPKIQVSSNTATSVEIWDYKIRPLVRGKNIIPLKDGKLDAKSLGFIQASDFFHTYFRNNNKTQSQQDITDIIEKYLYPFNKTDLFTITGNN